MEILHISLPRTWLFSLFFFELPPKDHGKRKAQFLPLLSLGLRRPWAVCPRPRPTLPLRFSISRNGRPAFIFAPSILGVYFSSSGPSRCGFLESRPSTGPDRSLPISRSSFPFRLTFFGQVSPWRVQHISLLLLPPVRLKLSPMGSGDQLTPPFHGVLDRGITFSWPPFS